MSAPPKPAGWLRTVTYGTPARWEGRGAWRVRSPAPMRRVCRDLADWPRSWMGFEKDLPPGETLVACFRPFMEHLAASGLSRKTLRRAARWRRTLLPLWGLEACRAF